MRADLPQLLSLEKENRWLMSPVERLVIVGLLETLRPGRSLELGHRFGGCTEWLCRYSQEVYSIDIDEAVIENCRRWPNARPIHADTRTALARLKAEGQRFDFALVDADHARESARDDLLGAAALADVIVLHDSANPECRAGYEEGLAQLNAFADLDLCDGHIQNDGVWGGMGIVLTQKPRPTVQYMTPRLSTAPILARENQVNRSRRYRLRHALQLLRRIFTRDLHPF